MKILCIGHGGGSLPLFLASKFRGKHYDKLELFDTLAVQHLTC